MDAPSGDIMTITGKGNKQRLVPLLPVVVETMALYLDACPFPVPPHGPLFLGARGKRLNAGVVQRDMRTLRNLLGRFTIYVFYFREGLGGPLPLLR